MFFKDRNEKIIFILSIIGHLFLFLLIYFKLGLDGFIWGSDARGYIQIAKNLLGGNGFSMAEAAPFVPDGFRTPMYPIFLAGILLIFKNLYFISLIQILLFASASLLIYRLGKEILWPTMALICSMLLILEPTTAYWNIMWLTETLFLFFFILGFYFFVKFYRNGSILNIFFSASFLGFAALTRPVAQGAWLIFLVFILFLFRKFGTKRILISLFIFMISFLAVVSPWLIRNKFYFNTYSFSTADAIIFSEFNLKSYLKINNLEDIDEEPDYLYGLTKRTLAPTASPADLNAHSYFMKKWLGLIFADPLGYAKVHIFSLVPYFIGDGYTELARQFFPDLHRPPNINWDGTLSGLKFFVFNHKGFEAVIFWGGKIFWGLAYLFVVLGAFVFLRKRNYFYLILFLSIIFYFALVTGAVAYSRYRFPANPFIFLLAAAGLYEFVLYFKKRYLKYG